MVVGNRADAQRLAIELGAALIVLSNGSQPVGEVLDAGPRARRGDHRLAARHLRLGPDDHARRAVPRLMEKDPLTVTHRVPRRRTCPSRSRRSTTAPRSSSTPSSRPVGLVTRSDLVAPPRRRVMLVDHAEQAQSVIGIDAGRDRRDPRPPPHRLDRDAGAGDRDVRPGRLDRDARRRALPPERDGAEPPDRDDMLLGAVLSDTVILNSATTTERDHAVVEYLERVLAVDARELGREMFEATADVSEVSAEEIVTRDAKQYEVRGGQHDLHRAGGGRRQGAARAQAGAARGDAARARANRDLPALRADGHRRADEGHRAAGGRRHGARWPARSGCAADDSTIELPGVMSRKKEVAPKLLAAL